MGEVMSKILAHHLETDTCYSLSPEAEKVFEEITNKYSGQFNLKYGTASQLSASQPELDLEEKSPVVIPTEIPHTYVHKAEFIVSTSYDHSETFSSVSTIYANK